MKISNQDAWATWLAANPAPEGIGPDPTAWPEDMPSEVMGDAYGYCVIYAASQWAEEMERLLTLDPEATVASVADQAFSTIDRALGRWGLTGFQYGAVVQVLSTSWEHGEELRVWHNLATQMHHEGEQANAEGGVLNPALLTINQEEGNH